MGKKKPNDRGAQNGGGGPEAANPESPAAAESEGAAHAEQKLLHYYLGFHLGQQIFALPLEQLREVVPLTAITRVPGAPPKVAGLVNLRGQIVCAFHARACLELPSTEPSQEPIVLVLQGFDEPLGLIVDSIADVYPVDPDRIEPPVGKDAGGGGVGNEAGSGQSAGGAVLAERARFLSGTLAVGGAVLGLLDLDRVILS